MLFFIYTVFILFYSDKNNLDKDNKFVHQAYVQC